MTRGSGDYDKTNTYTENFLQKDTFKEPFLNSIKAEKGGLKKKKNCMKFIKM